jgi:hypothetical protein
MRNTRIVLFLAALALSGTVLFAQESTPIADKLTFELEFTGSALSIDSEGVVDSFTDSGFDEDGTKIGVGYEGEIWGASAALTFGNENLRFLSGEIGEIFAGFPLALDELYGWVKPFGTHFKFTGGIFENTDGIADYTDDIDDFGMGVFFYGEDGAPFTEPIEYFDTALANGFLTDAVFGPVTVQLLLAPNYSEESASELASGLVSEMLGSPMTIDADARFLRLGGRIIADLGVGTVAAQFKTFQWPMTIVNVVEQQQFPGSKLNWTSFGAYFDLTAVENLGLSMGYTGFIPFFDTSDVDMILWSGIDLRATWTGIAGLSFSTHNNISFAQGKEKEVVTPLGKDSSFFTLYNAVGATKELNDRFSINAEIANVLSTTDLGNGGKLEYDNFGVHAKFITKVTEYAEFDVGAEVHFVSTARDGGFGEDDDSVTTFSVPIGIRLHF